MIIETLMTVALIAGGGSDYVPDSRQEVDAINRITNPPVPFKSVLPAENILEAGTPADNSDAAQGDTGPTGGVWHRLAVCESGMNGEPRWDYNGNSGFDGGLQFHPNTWAAFKPADYPSHAYMASPSQQVAVGKEVARAQGAGAWPSCTAKLGISTQELLQ